MYLSTRIMTARDRGSRYSRRRVLKTLGGTATALGVVWLYRERRQSDDERDQRGKHRQRRDGHRRRRQQQRWGRG
jgi:hypothetical protein